MTTYCELLLHNIITLCLSDVRVNISSCPRVTALHLANLKSGDSETRESFL